jgi:hypothetical protein
MIEQVFLQVQIQALVGVTRGLSGDGEGGYGSSSAWLAAKAGMTKKAARAAVREMRRLGERPLIDAALSVGDITG